MLSNYSVVIVYNQILFNKTIFTTWNFAYPFFLTTWHCIFSTIATQILARTNLDMLPGVKEVRCFLFAWFNRPSGSFLCFFYHDIRLLAGQSNNKRISEKHFADGRILFIRISVRQHGVQIPVGSIYSDDEVYDASAAALGSIHDWSRESICFAVSDSFDNLHGC
jgi:hypothetical protein